MRKFWLPLALLTLGAVAMAGINTGCTTDPATGKQVLDPQLVADTVDDVAVLAESYVTLFTKPGPDQDKLVAEIEVARKAADLPALHDLLAKVKTLGTPPTTQPAAPAVVVPPPTSA